MKLNACNSSPETALSVTIPGKTATNITGNVNMNSDKRESMTFREGVDHMFDRAALAMKLSPDAIKVVKACNAVLQLKFPVKLKQRTEVVCGWWAIHSAHRLPAKGGRIMSSLVLFSASAS